jgi:hypothetical protein
MTRTYALCLSLAFAAAGNAMADDITIDPFPFVSTATRAEVMEELRQHRMAGNSPWADDYNPLAQFRSGLTRAEVTAQFHASRNEVAAFSGEDSGSVHLARANAPAGSRATVVARAQ